MAEQQQQQSRVTTSMYEDMQYWQERCSICFDNHLDFCLNRCRDQFCRHCFNRYIGELVKSSWGMSVAKVKCPVCYDPLHANEWSKWVEKDVYELYLRNNHPYKTLSRSCPHCSAEVMVAKPFQGAPAEREGVYERIAILLGDLFRNREEAGDSLEQFQQMYRRQLSGEANESGRLITVAEIYRTILPNLTAAVSARSADDSVGSQTVANLPSPVSPRNPPAIIVGGRRRAGGKRRRRSRSSRPDLLQLLSKRGNQRRRVHTVPSASWYVASAPAPTVIMEAEAEIETRTNMANKISSLLISLETDTDAWRELQFLHLHNFSKYLCTNCSQRFCFQCNEPEWHSGHTCIEWMAECVRRHEAGSSIEAANEGSTEEELDVAATAAPTDMGAVDSSSSSLNSEGEISGPSNTALDLIATYKWKLNNSKNCPRCWTIINREEGCNKVDCLMCGNRFCWVCLSPWSEKCGFYRCHTEPLTPLSPGTDASKESQMQQQNQQEQITDTQSITDDNSKPELGVPDVSAIHSRRASAIPQQTG